MNKKILLFTLLGMFLIIPFASAYEFDDVREYNPISRTFTINNCNLWVVGCLIEGDVKVTASLNSPDTVETSTGLDKLVGWFDYETSEADVKASFGDLYLESKKNGKMISRGEQYKVYLEKKESVDDYKWQCGNNPKNLTECGNVEVGSHMEIVGEWKPIKNKNVDLYPNTKYKIGIFVDVEKGDHGDWIPMFAGKQVPEWAYWIASLDDVAHSYNLDEASGNAIDGTSTYNLSQNGSVGTTASGKISSARGTYATANYFTSNAVPVNFITDASWSISLWFKTSSTDASNRHLFYSHPDRLGGWDAFSFEVWFDILANNSLKLSTMGRGSLLSEYYGEDVVDGEWHNIVASHGSGASTYMYVDGINVAILPQGASGKNDSIQFDLGRIIDDGSPFPATNVYIDEVNIWSRTLTQTEVTSINNFNTDPNITLNSPTENTTYNSLQVITFNVTVFDEVAVDYVKLYVDDVLNQTNSSGLNNTDYLFDLNLAEGEYEIYVEAVDDESATAVTEVIGITIDTTPFVEFLTPPTLVNYANISQEYIPMKVNVTTAYFENITYSLRNVNGTNYTDYYETETYDINFTDMPDAHYHYDVTVCSDTGKCNSTETRHINHDATAPNITITSPVIASFITVNDTLNLNWTVTDDNLDKCWYNYNTTNITVTCTANTTTFNYLSGNNTLTFYANDTFGNIESEVYNWEYSIIENSQSYDTETYETEANTYEVYLTLNTDDTLDFAYLNYNGTEYLGTLTTVSTNYYKAEYDMYAPEVSAETNLTFYWTITYDNGSINYQNLTAKTQLVKTLPSITVTSSACGAGTFEALNYTFGDAQNLTALTQNVKYNFEYGLDNYGLKTAYGEVTGVTVLRVCINNTFDSYKLGYGELQYGNTGYTNRRFYMYENKTLSNSSTDAYTLYNLLTGSATSFIFEIKNTFLNPYTGKYLSLLRWYPELDQYKVTEMAVTDETGQTVMKVEVEDVDYRVGVYETNGSLIKLSDPVRMACLVNPCTYSQRIVKEETDYFSKLDVEGTLEFDTTLGRFVFEYNDVSQKTSLMNLTVYKETGSQDIAICQDSSTGYTGVLTCSIGNYTGNFYAKVYRSASPAQILQTLYYSIRTGVESTFGLFLAGIFALLTGLIGIFSPVGAIVLLIIGMLPALVFGAINLTIYMAIATLAGIVIHYIKKAND